MGLPADVLAVKHRLQCEFSPGDQTDEEVSTHQLANTCCPVLFVALHSDQVLSCATSTPGI